MVYCMTTTGKRYQSYNPSAKWPFKIGLCGGIDIMASQKTLLGIVVLGTAGYFLLNKASMDKIVNKVQSLITSKKHKFVVRHAKKASKPNAQALSTAEAMKDQTKKYLDSNSGNKVKKIQVSTS
jgi:hypothetical protein